MHVKEIDHSKCLVSTGIHEGLTFGSGKLDHYGYWETPCSHCAREFERKHPSVGECWPFKPETHDAEV